MRTHYETLGLPETASPEEVKRRFRELARKWHPDVAGSPDAAEKFKAINEAYRVLSDPAARAQYDADLKLRASRSTRQPSGQTTGRTGQRPPPNRPRNPQTNTRAAETQDPSYVIRRLLRDADLAMQRMNLLEAERICRAIIQLDRRNAAAHEILGDICAMRGRTENALAHYTIAVQLDPRNARLRAKFERMAAQSTAPGRVGYGRQRGLGPAAQAAALMLGVGAIGLIIAMVASFSPMHDSRGWVPWDWAPAVFLGLPTAGAIAGWVASYAGVLRPARTELLVSTSARTGRSVVPMGVILVVMSLACFWLAALLYAALASTQEALSRSILLAFMVSACLVAMFAGVAGDASGPILGLGGNMVFPALVAGWALADRSRS